MSNFETNREKEVIEDDKKSPKDLFLKAAKALLALVLVLVMIYFSGIREYAFFSRTPEDASITQMDKIIDVEEREIPITVILIEEDILGTGREESSIRSMIGNSSNILSQAGIDLEIDEIVSVDLDRQEVSQLIGGGFHLVELNEENINIILVKTLGTLNGLAYPGKNVAIMPDYLAGRDYRTLAHEVGHILGLGHKDDDRYVMNQGSYGLLFSKEEVIKMREKLDEKF